MRADVFFQISENVRYVAFYLKGQLALHERPALANSSAPESDKYEELIVNPVLLTLVQQPSGSPLFRHFGGVAHQTSLRSLWIMMTYSNSPLRGGRWPIQLPGHCAAGPLSKAGIPAWASPLGRSFPRRQNSS